MTVSCFINKRKDFSHSNNSFQEKEGNASAKFIEGLVSAKSFNKSYFT